MFSSHTIEPISSNRIEVNEDEQDTHLALSDNYLIEWNSSRKMFKVRFNSFLAITVEQHHLNIDKDRLVGGLIPVIFLQQHSGYELIN